MTGMHMLETIQYQCTQTSKNRVDYIRNLGCLDRLKIQVIYKYSDERFEIQEAVYEAQNRKLNKTIKNQSIYLWAFYFVPLIYISVFVPVPYCLDDCGFVVEPEVR